MLRGTCRISRQSERDDSIGSPLARFGGRLDSRRDRQRPAPPARGHPVAYRVLSRDLDGTGCRRNPLYYRQISPRREANPVFPIAAAGETPLCAKTGLMHCSKRQHCSNEVQSCSAYSIT